MRFLLICLILSSVLNAFECLLSEPFPDDDEFTDNEELVKDFDDPLIHESRRTESDEKTKGALSSVNRSIGEKISKGFKKGTRRVKGSAGNTDSLSSSAQKHTRDLKTRSVSKRKTKDTSGKIKTRKFISEANSSIGKKITKVYSKVAGSVKGGVGSVNHNGVLRSTKKHTQKLKAKSISKTKKKDTSGEKTRRFVHEINRRIESFFRNATGKVGSGVGNVTGTVVKGVKTVGNNTINLVTKSNNKTQTAEKGKDSSNSKKKDSSGSKERIQTAKESTGKNSTTTKS